MREKVNALSLDSRFYSKNLLGIKPSALIEMALFFIGFFIYDYFFGNGDRMVGSSVHPFWVIVVLMSAQYGTAEGLIAVILSTFFLYIGNVPEQRLNENYFDYELRLYYLPFLWLVTCLILGELQERKKRVKEDLEKKLHFTEIREAEITRSYELMRGVKEDLESRLVSQVRSSNATYQALKKMEEMKPAKVLIGVEDLVKNVLNPQKFSIFALGQNGLEATINQGWTEEDHFIRRFPQDSALYIALIGMQKLVCILYPEDQSILKSEGIMAAPLIDQETGAIFGALKIESLNIAELNISHIETFRSICEFAGIAYSHATHYQKILKNSIYDPGTGLFSSPEFHINLEHYTRLFETLDLPLCVIKMEPKKNERLTQEEMLKLSEKLKHLIPTLFGPLTVVYRTHFDRASFAWIVLCMEEESVQFTLKMLLDELEKFKVVPLSFLQVDVQWIHNREFMV